MNAGNKTAWSGAEISMTGKKDEGIKFCGFYPVWNNAL